MTALFWEAVTKARQHKYIRKYRKNGRWVYVYPQKGSGDRHSKTHELSKHKHIPTEDEIHAGASFSAGSEQGHFHVTSIKDGKVSFHLDDTDGKGTIGAVETLSVEEFQEHLRAAHADAHKRYASTGLTKRKEVLERAKKHGTKKQIARAKAEVERWETRHADTSSKTKPSDDNSTTKSALKMSEEELKQSPGVRILGQGAYGRVYAHPGPPPSAIKHGRVGKNEIEGGQVASDLGLGPKMHGALGESGEQRISMELLENHQPLAMIMPGALNNEDGARASAKILTGLAKFHRAGYGHGDLHGCNIMLDPKSGTGKVLDFGTAEKGNVAKQLKDLQRRHATGELVTSLLYGIPDAQADKVLTALAAIPSHRDERLKDKAFQEQARTLISNFHTTVEKAVSVSGLLTPQARRAA